MICKWTSNEFPNDYPTAFLRSLFGFHSDSKWMSNGFPKGFPMNSPRISVVALRFLRITVLDFQRTSIMISNGFPNHLQRIIFGFHSEFHEMSNYFHMIPIGSPTGCPINFKGLSSGAVRISIDLQRITT